MRRYNAFLLRNWALAEADRRLEVTHLQSGEQLRTDSLAALLEWVRDHADDTEAVQPTEVTSPGERASLP